MSLIQFPPKTTSQHWHQEATLQLGLRHLPDIWGLQLGVARRGLDWDRDLDGGRNKQRAWFCRSGGKFMI